MSDEPRILVVDDEPTLLKIMVRVLSPLPARVDTAADGMRALELMRATEYDLVISDVRMPQLDGAQLLQRAIEEKVLRGACVFLTGHADYSPQHLMRLGADEVLKKPISRNILIELAQRYSEIGRVRRRGD